MQHTTLKQIKYNRGQVTDLLSERVDMGLQNACGTVYNNIYINRYGQLQNAPCLEMATTNGGSNMNISAVWYDEAASTADRKVYYPIAFSRGLIAGKIALNIFPPVVISRWLPVTPVLEIPTGEEEIKTISKKTDLSSPIATYQIDSHTGGKICQFGSNFVVFGKDTNPWLFNIISAGNNYFDNTSYDFYAWKNQITGSDAIAYVGGRYNVYLNNNNYIYFSTETETDTYLGHFFITKGTQYEDMQQMVNLGGGNTINLSISGGIVRISAYVGGVEAGNVIPLDISDNFKRVIYTLSDTPSIDDKVYDDNFVLIGMVSGTGIGTIDVDRTTNDRYITGDTTHEIIDYGLTIRVREDFFYGAFDNIFVRGINTATPSGFTVPTSGYYFVDDDYGITTKKIITIKRNNAGGSFTQDLVGQVINCPQLSGAVQVREVVDSNTLKAYVLSPLIAANDGSTQININFDSTELTAKWVFGYVNPFSSVNGYPDSATYVNQRLIFGGNDNFGNLMVASRIAVINDFDPSDSTESDAFSASIASTQNCRIVDFVQSNDELRISTTYGEYAVSLSALTPSGIVQSGFQLRSQVGVKKDTPICDCGGLTAYVSNDGSAIHVTQFSLLQNKYSPISLTSQTEGIVNNCNQLVYLRNRDNDEGNLLIGLSEKGNLFGITIDTNAGLNATYNIYNQSLVNVESYFGGRIEGKLVKLFVLENVLFAQFTIKNTMMASKPISKTYLVKLSLNRIFDLSYGYSADSGSIELPLYIVDLAFSQDESIETSGIFVALYKDGESYSFIRPTGFTCDDPNADNAVATLTFPADIDQSKILTAGFVRQSDWRSVELSFGMATRELNKKIVKLSAVAEPIKFYGDGDYFETRYTIPEADIYKFFNLTIGKDVPKLNLSEVEKPVKNIYTENEDMSWRRAFDNPKRESHYGITFLAPFLIKSTTAVLEMDEVQ